MLTNEDFSLTSLISLTSTGLNIANFSQIKAALVARYKQVYGDDIDIDDTNADGVFINNIALLINNILQACSEIYAGFDVNTAVGSQLDVLCSLSNIRRKPASKSNATLLLTYTGDTPATYSPEELLFVDKSGNEWAAVESASFTLPDDTVSVFVECRKSGQISAPAGYIYQTVDATLPLIVAQENAANIGLEKEDDYSLRSRQTGSGSAKGTTTLSGLEASLRSISGIQDVKIINNASSSDITADDSTEIAAHDIYVMVRLQKGVSVPDATIGETIYNKLTPGIRTAEAAGTWGTAKSYDIEVDVNGISSSMLDTQTVNWKQCSGGGQNLSFVLTKYAWFTDANCEKIANYLMSYMNNLPIGTVPTQSDLIIQAVNADPLFKGKATYSVQSVPTTIANLLGYFNYTSFTTSTSGNNVTITLKS